MSVYLSVCVCLSVFLSVSVSVCLYVANANLRPAGINLFRMRMVCLTEVQYLLVVGSVLGCVVVLFSLDCRTLPGWPSRQCLISSP